MIEARSGAAGGRDLDHYLDKANIEIVPVDLEQAKIARRAYARFGKGRHPAGLSFGYCFAYALASKLAEPLLYKDEDFSKTDVETCST